LPPACSNGAAITSSLALLQEHDDDGRAYLIWTKALLAFRTSGDGNKSRRRSGRPSKAIRMSRLICSGS
jgi:hypothetical protein